MCGSTTWSTSPAATAASNALPPCSRTAIPDAEASQCVDATIPKEPRSSGRVVNTGANSLTSTPVRLRLVKIVCLVKQVPRGDAIEFDQETKSLRREGVPLELNQFDRHAVAAAVRLREQAGGEVVAMTMGPPQAADALRECIALGADRAIHLSDRVFAVADTLGTSRTLALAIGKEGGVDLVLCGRKTLDSETWQVPPEVAAFLEIPQLTSVVELRVANGPSARAARGRRRDRRVRGRRRRRSSPSPTTRRPTPSDGLGGLGAGRRLDGA